MDSKEFGVGCLFVVDLIVGWALGRKMFKESRTSVCRVTHRGLTFVIGTSSGYTCGRWAVPAD